LQLQCQHLDAVRPESHLEIIGRDDRLLDQQPHDALLFGGKELLPEGRGVRRQVLGTLGRRYETTSDMFYKGYIMRVWVSWRS
jgi:hypothetical protein